ncbi:hypothetical protein X772_31480 [Mesorhizobium sp. LSJC280B00]|nr:hypothetical protein X772_31480 [Mesorhizobium sp. LSJC280B00]
MVECVFITNLVQRQTLYRNVSILKDRVPQMMSQIILNRNNLTFVSNSHVKNHSMLKIVQFSSAP